MTDPMAALRDALDDKILRRSLAQAEACERIVRMTAAEMQERARVAGLAGDRLRAAIQRHFARLLEASHG